MNLELTSDYLSLEDFENLLRSSEPLTLAAALKDKVNSCRSYLDRMVENSEQLIDRKSVV